MRNAPLLIYGIGNLGREDDGLGCCFVNALPASHHYDICSAYQLNIEDAEVFARYERVLVVDAAHNLSQDFECRMFYPCAQTPTPFSTHGLDMAGVLAITWEIYHKIPLAQLLAISGHSFTIKDELSIFGKQSLAKALDWFLTSQKY